MQRSRSAMEAAIMTIPSTEAYKNNIGQPLAIISRSISIMQKKEEDDRFLFRPV